MKSKLKIATVFFVSIIIIAFIGIAVWVAVETTGTDDRLIGNIYINGTYTIDNELLQSCNRTNHPKGAFKTLQISGNLSKKVPEDKYLILSVNNLWVNVVSDNKCIATNIRYDGDKLEKTPGNTILYISGKDILNGRVITFEILNPYNVVAGTQLDNLMDMSIGTETSIYKQLLHRYLFVIILSIAFSLFGIFSFVIAGILFGKFDYKYSSFATVALFGSVYTMLSALRWYLPLWIDDPILCMVVEDSSMYFLAVSSVLYILTNVENKLSKRILNVCFIVSFLYTIGALVLQVLQISDLVSSMLIFNLINLLNIICMMFCLISEVVKKSNVNAKRVLISFLPIMIAIFSEAIIRIIGYSSDGIFLRAGILLTINIQLIQVVMLMKSHYDEAVRYEQMQKELTEARVSIMVSQIQPHFLYNSLTSIAMMCTKNPELAKKATINFADYLRGNMNSLKEQNPISFEKELEHLKKYLMLEEMRFGELLNIEYDIQTTAFSLPSLSVQPLVENAVKHGVGMLEDGGTVTIATREFDDRYEVIVSDNGVGFDTEKVKSDGKVHVGMNNVKHRLKTMSNAVLEIKSEVGKGTVSTIKIPKEEE